MADKNRTEKKETKRTDGTCDVTENAEQKSAESGTERKPENQKPENGKPENQKPDNQEPEKKDGAAKEGGEPETEKPEKNAEKKDPKDQKIADLTDRLQRQMAEFDNFRKRTEKEKALMYQIGAKDVIEKILPVVDNFERGLEAAEENDPFADGMQKIYKQMLTMLTDLGVKPIEAVGKEFDPNLHNAVMHTEDESVGENIVLEEFQKGYTYKDSVVRHSMVKVAN